MLRYVANRAGAILLDYADIYLGLHREGLPTSCHRHRLWPRSLAIAASAHRRTEARQLLRYTLNSEHNILDTALF